MKKVLDCTRQELTNLVGLQRLDALHQNINGVECLSTEVKTVAIELMPCRLVLMQKFPMLRTPCASSWAKKENQSREEQAKQIRKAVPRACSSISAQRYTASAWLGPWALGQAMNRRRSNIKFFMATHRRQWCRGGRLPAAPPSQAQARVQLPRATNTLSFSLVFFCPMERLVSSRRIFRLYKHVGVGSLRGCDL